jgi:O-antigen/teichoic acid export membrane protein
MVLFTVPLVIGGIVLAPNIINTFYGYGFTPSVFALQLLVIVIGISLINYPYVVMLVVADKQKKNFFITIAGAVVNIGLNFILIPRYGFYGSIAATMVVSFLVLIVTVTLSGYYRIIQIFNKKLLKTGGIAALAGFLMYLVVEYRFIGDLNVVAICAIGAGVYVGTLWLVHTFFTPITS